MSKILAAAAAAAALAGAADAKTILLTCRDSGNLYASPYVIKVDLQKRSLQIDRGERSVDHLIERVERDSAGYLITAQGGFRNAHIRVATTSDEKWVEYTDAFTNRTFAMDYCN